MFLTFIVVLAVLFVVAIALAALPSPKRPAQRDVFGFETRRADEGAARVLPPIERFDTRSGEPLAYRLYESTSARVLVFLHGSSYHGGGYHGGGYYRGGRGFGIGAGLATGIAIGAYGYGYGYPGYGYGYPAYAYNDYGGDCWIQHRVVFRYGRRIVAPVEVCD